MKYRLLSLFLFITLLSGCTSSSNKLTFSGSVECNEISLSNEVSGKILEIYHSDGESIKKGDKIAKIDTSDLSFKLKEANANLATAQATLKDIINGSRKEEIKKAKANLEASEAVLLGAKSKYDFTLNNLNDVNELYIGEGATEKSLDEAKQAVDLASSNYKSLQKQNEANKAALDLLISGATEEKIKAAKGNVDALTAKIEGINHDSSKGYIYSPIDGVIQTINYDIGEFVPISSKLTTILDLENQYVKIYIPEKYLNLISLNKELPLYSSALKNDKLLGKIVFISSSAEFTPKNVESKESKEELVFEVKIKIIKGLKVLKPGMLVDVILEGSND